MKQTQTPVPFRQKEAGNCGLYALANLFCDRSMFADMVPGQGQDTFELNRIFRQYRQDVYLTTDYLIPLGMGRMTDHTCFSPEDEWVQPGGCIAYVFIVGTGKFLHAIGGLMLATADRELFIVDSLRPHVMQTTAAEFMREYHVQGMLNFRLDQATGEQGAAACWNVDHFAHLTSSPVSEPAQS